MLFYVSPTVNCQTLFLLLILLSYLFTGSGSASSPSPQVRRESSSRVSSSSSYYNETQSHRSHNSTLTEQLHSKLSYITSDCTWNLSLAPLMSMRELRHSPTTMPMCLIRTTLLSRWLCMPPNIHWSSSEKKDTQQKVINCKQQQFPLGYLITLQIQLHQCENVRIIPERSSCSSESFSRLTLNSKALLT